MEFIFTLGQLFGPDLTLVLLRYLPFYEYVDGKPTDKKLGNKYEVIRQGGDYERFWVKVEGDTDASAIEEKLKKSTVPLLAAFENAVCKLYVDKAGKIQMSVRADAITVID